MSAVRICGQFIEKVGSSKLDITVTTCYPYKAKIRSSKLFVTARKQYDDDFLLPMISEIIFDL